MNERAERAYLEDCCRELARRYRQAGDDSRADQLLALLPLLPMPPAEPAPKLALSPESVV